MCNDCLEEIECECCGCKEWEEQFIDMELIKICKDCGCAQQPPEDNDAEFLLDDWETAEPDPDMWESVDSTLDCGDVVTLKGSDICMAVDAVDSETGDCCCVWQNDEGIPISEVYNVSCLMKVEE
jgi:hypothetical protein